MPPSGSRHLDHEFRKRQTVLVAHPKLKQYIQIELVHAPHTYPSLMPETRYWRLSAPQSHLAVGSSPSRHQAGSIGTIRKSLAAVELYIGTDMRAAWRLLETLTVALFDSHGATHHSYAMKWSCLTGQAIHTHWRSEITRRKGKMNAYLCHI